MKRLAATAAMLPLLAACAPVDGVLARYEMERKMWRAQFYERRINISFARGSQPDIDRAIAAFSHVLGNDPLSRPAAAGWDPEVVDDIRNLRLAAKIALANLNFLSERYADAGTLYRETVETRELPRARSLETRLGAARSFYLAGETSEVMDQCASIFRELMDDPRFLDEQTELGDVFLNVPVALVRMYRDNGDSTRADEFARLASEFYRRLSTTPGDTDIVWQARLASVQLGLVRGEWRAAERELASILDDPGQGAGDPGGLLLLRGEIQAFALGDSAAAGRTFRDLLARYAGEDIAYAARYDIAAMSVATGDGPRAEAMFREIERDDHTPPAIAARAMLARAALLENSGRWDDAYALLRRLIQIHPHTAAAIEAPLVVTRHYMAAGEEQMARLALDRARDYYLSLLDRSSQFAGDRMVVQAAMTEAFVAAGGAGDVAELLGAGSPRWDDPSAAAAMLRSAEVYETVLKDADQAATILKKCVERFPETRYSRVAQRRLDELEGRSE